MTGKQGVSKNHYDCFWPCQIFIFTIDLNKLFIRQGCCRNVFENIYKFNNYNRIKKLFKSIAKIQTIKAVLLSDIYFYFIFSFPKLTNYFLSSIQTKIDQIWGIGFDWHAIWYTEVGMTLAQNSVVSIFGGWVLSGYNCKNCCFLNQTMSNSELHNRPIRKGDVRVFTYFDFEIGLFLSNLPSELN